jgi:hypothetical protein
VSNQQPPSRAKNMAYAAVAGQAGCFTLIIVMIALFAGLWLDRQFNVRGIFTLGLLLLSIPLSLYVMVRIALGSIRQIQPSQNKLQRGQSSPPKEE